MVRVIYNNGKNQRSNTYLVTYAAVAEGRYREAFSDIYWKAKAEDKAYKVREMPDIYVVTTDMDLIAEVPELILKKAKSKITIKEVIDIWRK